MATDRLNKDMLQERAVALSEAQELESRARKLRQRVAQIEAIAEAELVDSEKQSIKRCGHLLAWAEGRATVAWKDEFIRVAGVEAADELAKNAAPKPKLQITLA